MRELLVSFYGNELVLGIILANWVLLEALGVFAAGRYIDRAQDKATVFIALEVIFSLVLPVAIYLSRASKGILGVPCGEGIGLPVIFISSLLIILIPATTHGALFATAVKLYSRYTKEDVFALGRVYAWELFGTLIGGIILTYLFIPYLGSVQVTFILAIINLLICAFFFRYTEQKKIRYTTLFGALLAVYLFFSAAPGYLEKLSVKQIWKKQEVLSYRNSIYGNVAVTRESGQYNFFYNGLPVISAPVGDRQFAEEFGNLPLLFCAKPRDILVIGAGAGGLLNEILKQAVERIDYLELDPLIITMLKKFPTALTKGELTDRRVNIINTDGRFFLKNNSFLYDVILIGFSKPSDLSKNRFFTQEFFFLAKKRLAPEGILAFWLPGSLVYLSPQLRDLNTCILSGLREVFSYVRIIPGDYNIFLASSSGVILQADASLISRKIAQLNLKNNILVPEYLAYRLDKKWVDWFNRASYAGTRKANRDWQPFALYQMLILWNQKFSPSLTPVLTFLGHLKLWQVAVFAFFLTFLLLSYFIRSGKRKLKIATPYAIATTGFFAMLSTLILIFSYQVLLGFLYRRIGLLMSIFMAGAGLASILITRRMHRIKNCLNWFLALEILLIIYSCILAISITGFLNRTAHISFAFGVMFFISGLLTGAQFPLAGRIYPGIKERVGEAAGTLYAADLVGGCIAGIFGGIILLPVLGLFGACMVMLIFKLSSLSVLIFCRRNI